MTPIQILFTNALEVRHNSSHLCFVLDQNFPVSILNGYGFYYSGEVFGTKLYLHISREAFLAAMLRENNSKAVLTLIPVKNAKKSQTR